jgi:hypothetical protein
VKLSAAERPAWSGPLELASGAFSPPPSDHASRAGPIGPSGRPDVARVARAAARWLSWPFPADRHAPDNAPPHPGDRYPLSSRALRVAAPHPLPGAKRACPAPAPAPQNPPCGAEHAASRAARGRPSTARRAAPALQAQRDQTSGRASRWQAMHTCAHPWNLLSSL